VKKGLGMFFSVLFLILFSTPAKADQSYQVLVCNINQVSDFHADPINGVQVIGKSANGDIIEITYSSQDEYGRDGMILFQSYYPKIEFILPGAEQVRGPIFFSHTVVLYVDQENYDKLLNRVSFQQVREIYRHSSNGSFSKNNSQYIWSDLIPGNSYTLMYVDVQNVYKLVGSSNYYGTYYEYPYFRSSCEYKYYPVKSNSLFVADNNGQVVVFGRYSHLVLMDRDGKIYYYNW
jgi:uncharacterized protein YlbG (UPF0298 family)